MNAIRLLAVVALGFMFASAASAQDGPVAQACKDDIAKLCAGKSHGDGEVRDCLEDNFDKTSAACQAALDATGDDGDDDDGDGDGPEGEGPDNN